MGNNIDVNEFIKNNAIKDVFRTIDRLSNARNAEKISQYKTLIDVFMHNLQTFYREVNYIPNGKDNFYHKDDLIAMALIRAKIEDELLFLYKFKEDSFKENDTRDYRDVTICYDRLSSSINNINERYRKYIDKVDFNDDDIQVRTKRICGLIEKEDWTKSGDIDISRWTKHAVEQQKQDELTIRNKTSQISIRSDGAVKIESQKINLDDQTQFDKTYELLKLAYESNILLDSRNRGIGKTTALFKLAEEEDLLICVPHVRISTQLNKQYKTDRFVLFSDIRDNIVKANNKILVDEISPEKISRMQKFKLQIVGGFIKAEVPNIDLLD